MYYLKIYIMDLNIRRENEGKVVQQYMQRSSTRSVKRGCRGDGQAFNRTYEQDF